MKKELSGGIDKSRFVTGLAAIAIVAFFSITGFYFSQHQNLSGKIRNPAEANFYKICVSPVLSGTEISLTCKTAQDIEKNFGIDVFFLLEQEKSRMIMTARRLVSAEIADGEAYKKCLKEGECAPVPLPSKDSPKNEEMFWHLAENVTLTPDLCDFMELCRALSVMGIVNREKEGGI